MLSVPFRQVLRPSLHFQLSRTVDSLSRLAIMPDLYDDRLPTPKKQLAPDESTQVGSKSSDKSYTCKRISDHYSCACPAWKMQKGVGIDVRTCKHLRELLGNPYEDARLALKKRSFSTSATSSAAAKTTTKKRAAPSTSTATKSTKKAKAAPSPSDDDAEVDDPSGSVGKKSVEVLLANKFDIDGKKDCTGWWVSEKLDGVRAFWDGQDGLWSRLGNRFYAPKWFIEKLPKGHTLDGELFHSRSNFSATSSIVRSHASEKWDEIRYQVFDIPSLAHLPFESRLSALEALFPHSLTLAPISEADKLDNKDKKEVVALVKQVPCKGLEHLIEMLREVEKGGGEGLMLREPKSLYVGKRSNTLLKVKTFYDAEAKVIGYEPGKGKYVGMTGSLLCQMESGKTFNVGSGLNDDERAKPPRVGSIISYRFGEITKEGVPRFPTYVGVRGDVMGAKDAEISKKAEQEKGNGKGKGKKNKDDDDDDD